MLRGREAERAAIDGMLDGVRAGEGGALAIRGEPGIGKSALLAYAAERAGDLRVLRAVAVQAESGLAFASLHQLLGPVLELVEALPEPQRRALLTAFGIGADPGPDRFLVSVAVLTLLSEAAGERPVLCLVDDAHWADAPSLDALTFVARRVGSEPIGLLLAVRDGEGRGIEQAGLPELALRGLDPAAAEALLDERWSGLDPALRERVLRSSGGNPLALLELPGAGADWEPGRLPPVGEPLPLADELERAFLGRVRWRDPAVQTLVLVAAADGSGEVAGIGRAAALLGVDPGLLGSEDLTDLLRVDGATVGFRHPLVRSAVYFGAAPAERRAVHRALAEALSGDEGEADRRAWHLALAADGPDEEVAGELERSAERALRRSGHAAAAAAWERAAELSPSDGQRARRLVAGAEAFWNAGQTARARALLEAAERLGLQDAEVRVGTHFLRGSMELRAGVPVDGLALLLPAAREAAAVDPGRALHILLVAREASFLASRPEMAAEIAAIAAGLDPPDPAEALVATVLRAFGPDGARGDTEAMLQLIATAEEPDDPALLQAMGGMAWGMGDLALARRLRARAAARARALGAMGTLAWALEYVVFDELTKGAYAAAEAWGDEGRRLALETDRPNSACAHTAYLAEIVALRGREKEAGELAEEALAQAIPRRLVKAASDANRALGGLALAAGRPDEALDHLEALWGSGPAPGGVVFALASVPDQLEAAVRAGRADRRPSEEMLAAHLAWVETIGSLEMRALAARCQALLASGEDAERHYLEALRLHAAASQPLDHARTELLYGEHLRRERRRVDARPHLRTALETFERLGAGLWAERARTELRATGETARRRDPGTLDQLSPQELRIIRHVSEGATNRDVAAQLFISPRTVDYHLRSVFRKLGISSRKELIHLALTEPGLGSGAG